MESSTNAEVVRNMEILPEIIVGKWESLQDALNNKYGIWTQIIKERKIGRKYYVDIMTSNWRKLTVEVKKEN